jgi:hypothetical protein
MPRPGDTRPQPKHYHYICFDSSEQECAARNDKRLAEANPLNQLVPEIGIEPERTRPRITMNRQYLINAWALKKALTEIAAARPY